MCVCVSVLGVISFRSKAVLCSGAGPAEQLEKLLASCRKSTQTSLDGALRAFQEPLRICFESAM